jgi:methylthioribulose-1-phosphate dehydratase
LLRLDAYRVEEIVVELCRFFLISPEPAKPEPAKPEPAKQRPKVKTAKVKNVPEVEPEPISSELLIPHAPSIQQLCRAGHQFWQAGWSRGTSSNYSVVLDTDPLRLLVTASGKDKGHLLGDDFVIVDSKGSPDPSDQPKSSAETLLHTSIANHQSAGAILHTHSVWATLLSEHFAGHGGFYLEGYEFLKGLEGISTHEERVWIPIFENTQEIPALAEQVESYWQSHPDTPHYAYLIRRHGMYTWADDLASAIRHIEVLEFLLECVGRTTKLV